MRETAVKPCRRDLKSDMLRTCHKLMAGSRILYVLRRVNWKVTEKVFDCAFLSGRVFVWVKLPNCDKSFAGNSRILVNTQHRQYKFCVETLETPLTSEKRYWSPKFVAFDISAVCSFCGSAILGCTTIHWHILLCVQTLCVIYLRGFTVIKDPQITHLFSSHNDITTMYDFREFSNLIGFDRNWFFASYYQPSQSSY